MAKSSDLLFRILGKDVSASKALKGVGSEAGHVGKKLGGFTTAFAGIGTAAAVAGGVIALDFGKKSVDAFIAAQSEQAKFDDAFARVPGLDKYKTKIDELAVSLATKTRFDDDATKSAAALLSKFDLTGDKIAEILPLAQDYAAFTGKDLPDATRILGKAFLGNTKALKDLGIAYKPTGDKAKDMAAIMDKVREKVGGFAEKEGKTAAGTAAILTNQFGEVQEKIGSYLVPALTTLGQWIIQTVIPAISDLVDWFKVNLLPIIMRIAGWVQTTFIPAMKDLADAFMKNVWPAIKKFAAILAENLQPAIAAVVDMWTTTLMPALVEAWPRIRAVVGVVALLVAGMVLFTSKVIGFVVPAIAKFISWIVGLNTKVKDTIIAVKDRFAGLVDFIKGLPAKIAVAAGGMWNGIKDSFRGAINWIIDKWNGLSFSLPGVDVPGIGQVGGFSLDTPNIPRLASGGIVTRPTLALVGEAGPEAVIPLSRAGGMGGGVTIHVAGSVVGGTPEQIARALADYLKRAQGSGRVRTA